MVCIFKLTDLNSRFAVMSDTHFHGSVFDLKIWMSDCRKCTWSQSDSDTSRIVDCFLCRCNYFIKVSAFCSFRASNFPHQNFTGYSTTFLSLILRCGCHIIICNYCFYCNSLAFRHFYSHFYVHVVSGIVSVQTGNTFSLICNFEAIQKSGCCRGRTDFSNCGCIAHIFTDITDKCRFVS